MTEIVNKIKGFYGDLFLGGDWDFFAFAFRDSRNIPIGTKSGITIESRSVRKKPPN